MAKTIEQLTREVLKEILREQLNATVAPATPAVKVTRKYVKSGKYTNAAKARQRSHRARKLVKNG